MRSIFIIKFRESTQIGPGSTIESYLEQGLVKDGYRLKIEFDDDARFIHLTGQHTEKAQVQYHQLIPMTSVASILLKPDSEKSPTPKK